MTKINPERDIKVFTAMFAGPNASADTCFQVQANARKKIAQAPGFHEVISEPTMNIANEQALIDATNRLHDSGEDTVVGTITNKQSASLILDNCPDIKQWVGPAVVEEVIELAHENGKTFVPGVTTLEDINEAAELNEQFGGSVIPMIKIYPAFYKDLKEFAQGNILGAMSREIEQLKQRGCTIEVRDRPDDDEANTEYVCSPTQLAALVTKDDIDDKTIVVYMPDNKPRKDIEDVQALVEYAHKKGFEVTISAIEGGASGTLDEFVEYLGQIIGKTDAESVVIGHTIFDWDSIAQDDPEPSIAKQEGIADALIDARDRGCELAATT